MSKKGKKFSLTDWWHGKKEEEEPPIMKKSVSYGSNNQKTTVVEEETSTGKTTIMKKSASYGGKNMSKQQKEEVKQFVGGTMGYARKVSNDTVDEVRKVSDSTVYEVNKTREEVKKTAHSLNDLHITPREIIRDESILQPTEVLSIQMDPQPYSQPKIVKKQTVVKQTIVKNGPGHDTLQIQQTYYDSSLNEPPKVIGESAYDN